MSETTDRSPPPPVPPAERRAPWVQLRFFTFHPAVFSRMMGDASPDAHAGDLVSVYDKAGRFCGNGLFNPRAKIPLRVVRHGAEPAGEEYFEDAIRRAIAFRRETLRLDESTEAYRLINSDGDGLSGLTIDRFGPVLAIEAFSLGIVQRLPGWLPLIHELAGTRHHVLNVEPEIARVERITPPLLAAIGEGPGGPAPKRIKIRENNIAFEVDLERGHKTGFFCDQRDNRARAAQLVAEGARVLDLCSYSLNLILSPAHRGSGAAEI
ncbi:MAG: class I SAM-dependent rRNA methyltransferase [Opitutaceae bacterium]